MTAFQLPTGLAQWAGPLAVLDPQLAVALGPLVRQLDQLLGRQESAAGLEGELDGYGGLSRRGDPTRLVMSEWSLAEEFPFEFLRRAASAELLYLAPNLVEDRSRGRVAVLVDCGPDQIGAGRLVQLAVLIVASRRAARRGAELMVGVLGDEPGSWRTGDFKSVLRGWLNARRAVVPDASEVERWSVDLDKKDECWLLTGRRLAKQVPGRRRTVVSAECAWGARGATAVEVLLDGDRVELALPHGDIAIRALRGAAFRTEGPALSDSAGMRTPRFTGAPPWLLGRGHDPTELIAVQIPFDGRPAGRPKRHQFPGAVLTGAFIGRRLVALVLADDDLRVVVRGKHLGHVDRVEVSPFALGLDPDAVDAIARGELPPMVFEAGDLLLRLSGVWWRLSPDNEPRDSGLSAALPGERPDVPRMAWAAGDKIWAPPTHVPAGATDIVLGPDKLTAWREDVGRWHIAPGGTSVSVPDGESVLGIAVVESAPALITVSPGGLIARLRWPGAERTLTKWSGGIQAPTLHPTKPWIAVQRDDQRVEVVNLQTNSLLLTVAGTI
jgi:hypothetical protein